MFSQLPHQVLNDYDMLIMELTNRYRVIETPKTYAAFFSARSQKQGETIEEYAAELKCLYDKAHGYRDARTRQEDLVRRFLDGLWDVESKFEVEFNKEPRTIDEAVLHVVNFMQTKGRLGRMEKSKRQIRKFNDFFGSKGDKHGKGIRGSFKEILDGYNGKDIHDSDGEEKTSDDGKDILEKIPLRLEKLENNCRQTDVTSNVKSGNQVDGDRKTSDIVLIKQIRDEEQRKARHGKVTEINVK